MNVHTEHAAYTAAKARWQRCRDAYQGGDAVRARGTDYLPKLDAQTDAEYRAYQLRADFYGATQRTVDGLAGSVFRREPAVQAPESVTSHLQDITLGGVPFQAFAKRLVEDDLQVGRAGVLVDMPAEGGPDARPYWVPYAAEQIVNWDTQVRRGRRILSLVVLREEVSVRDAVDPFVCTNACQYRVLQLVPGAGDAPVYQVTLWRQATTVDGKLGAFTPGAPMVPQRRGTALDFIPFVFLGPSGITPDIEKPPILDLADMNLSHYRSSADLERARFFVASPTAVITGFSSAGVTADVETGRQEYRIGSAVAWTFQNENTKAFFLEVNGQGLPELRLALKDKQELMAVLGARLLESQQPDAEAAATVKMRHAGDESVLKKLTMAVDQALTQLLRWHVWWTGLDVPAAQVTATLGADFLQVMLAPDLVAKLLLLVQAGKMSFETFYWNLTRGDLTRPGVSVEEERKAIEADEDLGSGPIPPQLEGFAGESNPPADDQADPEADPAAEDDAA